MEKITISAIVQADIRKAWDYYTQPEHITGWNFASDDWHCPRATNDMRVGGQYCGRMEAKDGSFGFDFVAVYTAINVNESFTYVGPEGRVIDVFFKTLGNDTEVVIQFDPETVNPIELQRNGWQAILNNFKKYTETH